MPKKSTKRKKRHAKKPQSKNRNSKKPVSKRKSTGTKSHSGHRKVKKVAARKPRAAKTKTLVRVSRDTRFWRNRKRRRTNAAPRAAYSIKSLRTGSRSPVKGIKYTIKKKMKQTPPLNVSLKTDKLTLLKQTSRYLKLKKSKKGKRVFIKAVMRDKNGVLKFTSVKRRLMHGKEDILSAWNVIFSNIRSIYGGADIVGYEIEEIVD